MISLRMEDHYVRAYTAQGSAPHLMTFSDAMVPTAWPGLPVHRSGRAQWEAVAAVLRGGR